MEESNKVKIELYTSCYSIASSNTTWDLRFDNELGSLLDLIGLHLVHEDEDFTIKIKHVKEESNG